jgi:hypothetical protein
MDDGELRFGQKCCHIFDISKTNHITVEARWDGGRGNGTLDLCAFVEDYHDERSGDTIRDLRRGWGRGSWIDASFFYCEMGGPEIQGGVTLHDAIGRIEIWVMAWGEESDFNYWETHDYIATYETITFEGIWDDLDIPECSDTFIFEIDFILWDGRIGSYDFVINIDYPEP